MSQPQPSPQEDSSASKDSSASAALVSPNFKMIFITVVGLTVLLFIAGWSTALIVEKPDEDLKKFMETCNTLTTGGFGAIFGLFGGKIP